MTTTLVEPSPNKIQKLHSEGLTFDDVLLIPRHSEVIPNEVHTQTYFSRNIPLNIPLVSAAMDTVTETAMAIALAQQGGIGVLHKRLSVKSQAEMVRKVKRSEAGMIIDPITLPPKAPLAEAEKLMGEYKISGVPITAPDGRLLGILTNRDMRFELDHSKQVSDLMTKENLITVPVGTTLAQARDILQQHKVEKLLVVDDDYILKGLITIKDLKKNMKYPQAAKDQLGRLRVAAAVGISDDLEERASSLVKAGVDALVLDSAHGHSQKILDALVYLKESYSIEIVAGNIATQEGAKALIERGADAVKVGVGPGSICTTRVVTGVGMPQLSAIMSASEVALENGVPVIADGGIKHTGDLAKAIAAGADTIMVGSMLAGTEEAPGESVLRDGRRYKVYRGMGSLGAMQEGSGDRYFQTNKSKLVPEGVEGIVAYKGTADEVIEQMIGGLKSAMGYCGTLDITTLKREGQFTKITSASLRESHPHDVTITKDAPNYALSKR